MTPLPLVAFLTAPALFPGLHPVAVWFGLGCVAVCAWVWWKADDELGGCETTLRAMEDGELLKKMQQVRVA